MSKLTKIIIGALAVVAISFTAANASFTYTSFLKQGSKGSSVMSLQQTLNMTSCQVAVAGKAGSPGMETSYFGPATTAAVKCFQAANGLTVDGLVGKNTGAALAAVMGGGGGLPAGCTSTSGFSPTTGQPCNSGGSGTVLPPGCTSTGGYSPITGQSCASGNSGNQTGPVVASLSQDNPAAGTIVAGQATADLMHITFTGSGTVSSVTLTRGGISDQNTLTNVYLYDGVTRLTDGYSFNTNGTITMNNLNLAVNGSRTISVKADVYASTTSYDIFVTLSSYSAGTSVNTVSIKGNQMFIAGSGTLATASVSGANTVAASGVNAGTSSFTVWRAPIQINTRTLMLKAANFRITGSAPSDALQNVGLYVDGVKTGNNAMVTMTNGSNYLSFDMTGAPLALITGSHTVEVRGDVVKGSSFSFTVSLQQASDLMVMDPQVGVNIALSGTIPNAAGLISIGTGSFTAVVDPTFSSMSNVTASASNVPIARFKLHGYGEDIKVTSLPITTVLSTPTPAAAGLQNLTLYFNGAQIGSQLSQAIGLNTFTLGSQMIIPAGVDSYLEVRADLRTTGGTNYTAGDISANLGAATAEGWNSHASITGPTATGNILTMQAGTLALSKNAGYANQNVSPNTVGAKIGSFVLQNQSTSESIRVTTLSILTTYGAGAGSSNLSGMRTSETSGNAGIPQQPATAAAGGSATNTFSTDFTLAPGAVKTIDIFADSSSATGGTVTVLNTLTVSSIGMTSNVSATSAATAGQTITFLAGTLGTPTINSSGSTALQLIATANGGAPDGSVAQYHFSSANSTSTITELTFTVTTGTATYVKVGSSGNPAPVVAGSAYITGLNIPVTVSGTDVNVYVSYAEVGPNGIASNTSSTLTLTTIKSISGNTSTTSTVSVSPGAMTLVGSKPVVGITSTTVNGLNMGGENKIGEVTITADAKGNIKINDIQFSVSNVGFTTIPTFTNARIADGTTTVVGSSCGQGVAAAASQTIFCEFGTVGNTFTTTTGITNVEINTDFDGYTITAGQSKTFSLFATVAAANTGTNLAQISTSLVAAGFNWDDATYAQFVADASPASPSAGTNLTGSVIYNFPTGSYTIKQ